MIMYLHLTVHRTLSLVTDMHLLLYSQVETNYYWNENSLLNSLLSSNRLDAGPPAGAGGRGPRSYRRDSEWLCPGSTHYSYVVATVGESYRLCSGSDTLITCHSALVCLWWLLIIQMLWYHFLSSSVTNKHHVSKLFCLKYWHYTFRQCSFILMKICVWIVNLIYILRKEMENIFY